MGLGSELGDSRRQLWSSSKEHPWLTFATLTARFIARSNWRLWIPGAFDQWELIQAQELHGKLRLKQTMQQLNSDIGSIAAWLKKTGAELEALKSAEPPSNIQEMALRVKRLQVSGAVGGGRGEVIRAGSHCCWTNRPGFGVAGSIRGQGRGS